MDSHAAASRRTSYRAAAFVMLVAVGIGWPPAARAAEEKIIVAGYVAVRSFDAVQKLANQLGIPLPPPFSVTGIEQNLPFVGRGGLASDQPVGVVFFAGPDVVQQNAVAFVLPVKPDHAALDSFKDQGAKSVAGSPDTVTMNGGTFRRTDQHLVFGSNCEGITGFDPSTLSAALKEPKALVRLLVDFKSIRAAAPEQFDEFFEKNGMGNAGPTASEQAGGRLAVDFMKGLEGVGVALDREPAGLRLRLSIRPLKLPPPTPGVMRPGMPKGVAARYDLACAPAEAIPLLKPDSFKKLMTQAMSDEGQLTPQQREWMADHIVQAWRVLLGADATSVGIDVAGGAAGPVVYVVNQYTRPVDVIKELREVADQAKAMSKEQPVRAGSAARHDHAAPPQAAREGRQGRAPHAAVPAVPQTVARGVFEQGLGRVAGQRGAAAGRADASAVLEVDPEAEARPELQGRSGSFPPAAA